MSVHSDLLRCTEHIRNVCFLAHVDHGKTTLSDSLISSVGIISERLSGKLRYLDNREDEQRRMITIKSSSISLIYSPDDTGSKTGSSKCLSKHPCIINLVDCPGHVDFSVEVSTAARLCDGALLIIDAVEGICPQTKAVLRQAWRESVRTVLVLNKVDKLILDIHMTPAEAYNRLRDLVDQVNALMFQLYDEYLNVNNDEEVINVATTTNKEWFFCPSEGNVVFCSALHRWCINLPEFSSHIVEKLNIPASKSAAILKALWSDTYYCSKTKTLKPGKGRGNPLFVQFVLDQIWKVYDCILTSWSPPDIEKCINYCGTTLSPRQAQLLKASDVPSSDEREELLTTVMGSWIPIPNGIIRMIIDCLHNPIEAAKKRLKGICPAIQDYHAYEEVISCEATAPTVVHVAKFLGCDLNIMRLTGDVLHGNERAGEFVAFARIFSGALKVGSRLYICGSANVGSTTEFDDTQSHDEPRRSIYVERIMLCMGADLLDVETGWPGNIVALYLSQHDVGGESASPSTNKMGIRDNMGHVKEVMAWILSLGDPHRQKVKHMGNNLDNRSRFTHQGTLCSVDRHLTLSTDPTFPRFPPLNLEFNNPIIRVSIEPQNVKHTDEFLMGLAYLYISDPAVEIDVLKTGEYVLSCCGEIHLERCINDLTSLYANVAVNVSKPRVSVREGIVNLVPTDTSTVAYSRALSKSVNFPPWQNNTNSIEEPLQTPDLLSHVKSIVPIKGMPGVYMTTSAQKKGTEYATTTIGDAVLLVRALQMPAEVLDYLETNNDDIKRAIYGGEAPSQFGYGSLGQRLTSYLDKVESDIRGIWTECTANRGGQFDVGDLWAISTYRGSRTMLFYNHNSGLQVLNVQSGHVDNSPTASPVSKQTLTRPASLHWRFKDTYKQEEVNTLECSKVVTTIISGFEIASQCGPCTEEPLRGVVFVIEGLYTNHLISGDSISHHNRDSRSTLDLRYGRYPSASNATKEAVSEIPVFNFTPEECSNTAPDDALSKSNAGREDVFTALSPRASHLDPSMNAPVTLDPTADDQHDTESQFSDVLTLQSSRRSGSGISTTGNMISCMRSLCRKAMMQRGRPRIYESVYKHVELQCDQTVLGKMYSVLQKRRTQIISENVRNVTNTFVIEGMIPASESFGLAQDLRSKASGGVIFHLQFSHWELNPDDPFPEVSMTDEAYAGFNMARMLQANVPRKIINNIRKMKGLPGEEKVVAFAEKQRTLSTKK
ncbi:Elongation factor Tu-like protein [Babesia divergens]|uniref:Elongation factor Tu-like protein n=1 Tax=Babesia divergens TaxID=32595 RepID=A0AAD9GCR8_BABDI|nr:Elongation factor Tu-like protein [Babesia divergens]